MILRIHERLNFPRLIVKILIYILSVLFPYFCACKTSLSGTEADSDIFFIMRVCVCMSRMEYINPVINIFFVCPACLCCRVCVRLCVYLRSLWILFESVFLMYTLYRYTYANQTMRKIKFGHKLANVRVFRFDLMHAHITKLIAYIRPTYRIAMARHLVVHSTHTTGSKGSPLKCTVTFS